jgi:hypothetical protein
MGAPQRRSRVRARRVNPISGLGLRAEVVTTDKSSAPNRYHATANSTRLSHVGDSMRRDTSGATVVQTRNGPQPKPGTVRRWLTPAMRRRAASGAPPVGPELRFVGIPHRAMAQVEPFALRLTTAPISHGRKGTAGPVTCGALPWRRFSEGGSRRGPPRWRLPQNRYALGDDRRVLRLPGLALR